MIELNPEMKKKIITCILNEKISTAEDISEHLNISINHVIAYLNYYENLNYIKINQTQTGKLITITDKGEQKFNKI